MSRADDALQRLYESADLRDELTDDEAEQMLKWAEAELTRLDAASADDAAFELGVETLMDLLKKLNRFAGRQGQLSSQASDQAPVRIAALAAELGHAASAEQIAAAGTGDPTGTLTALITLMSGTAQTASGAPAPESLPATESGIPSTDESAKPQSSTPACAEPPIYLSFGDDFDEIDL